MNRSIVVLLLFATACRDPRTMTTNPPPATEKCGDGIVQAGEDCDGSAPGDDTCQTLGFDEGTLLCNARCAYETTLCTRRCGNGMIDPGEACDGALGVPSCDTWGANTCTATCTLETRFCVAPPFFTAGPELVLDKGGAAVLGDVAPAGPGDLVMAVPAFQRVELFPWAMTRGFETGTSRKLSFQRSPVRAEVADLDGDGSADVLVINDDGSLDQLQNTGTQYALQPLDGACAGRRFIPTDGAAPRVVLATGCSKVFEITNAGVTGHDAPGLLAATRGPTWADAQGLHLADGGTVLLPEAVTELGLADFDGDGDDDLAAIVSTAVKLYENTGAGFALKSTFPAGQPADLRAIDLDGDGRADLFWSDGAALQIRRGAGAFTFSPGTVDAGAGAHLSLAIGDADGDSDLDVALTITTGADSTLTRVFLNRSH